MSVRRKSDAAFGGPDRVMGVWDPSFLTDSYAYWDARDVGSGAITSWVPRFDITSGNMQATGTGTGSGTYVQYPRFATNGGIGSNGPSTLWGFWSIFEVETIGSDVSARTILYIMSSGSTPHGQIWYNYSGNVFKISNGNGITTPAAGISQLSVNTKYLAITNYEDSTHATAYVNSQNGTSTAVTLPNYSTGSKVYIGRDYNNQTNTYLVGKMYACGLATSNIDSTGRSLLRGWAASEFGVAT